MKQKGFIKVNADDVPVYEPSGHKNTYNRRLAGLFNGSENIEFIIGEMHSGGGAERHVHSNVDQMMYVMDGTLRIISPGGEEIAAPGDLVVFIKGEEHEVQCESEFARFIVLYSPPRDKT